MNEKALYDLTYGLFLVGTKADGKENACITNTVIQLASSPARVSLSCINGNLTPELIKKSGRFTVTILDETAPFSLFESFGLKHGRDTDKFAGYNVQYDEAGMPYIKNSACALLSCRVLSYEDLGSHTLFIAEVTDAEKLSFVRPVTYAQYHTEIKPQKKQEQKEKKQIGWRCEICGYVYEDNDLPDDFVCPWCGHPKDDFEPLYED
jgi:flavin reductase (DIM6/NTAB) family NADH-FMN oxidoreductase RutF/rubredoxin